MGKAEKRRLGAIAGAAGLFLLALNLADYYAGWYRVADGVSIVGGLLAVCGAAYALANY